MLKILELFGGIGAPRKALERLGIDIKVIDYVEIDKYAVKSYNSMYEENFEPQDITTWDKQLEVDLIFHGSPCQDFSLAGKQAGGDEGSGTRSSLLYETVRIVSNLKPKYVIWENVKNVISKKHRHNFDNYLKEMEQLGYTNYYQVLNAKDYSIPQNRERVFTISILGEHKKFEFPQKQELKLRLKDILEQNVDEKYYIKDYQLQNILNSNFEQNKRRIQVKSICDTLCARDWKDPKCVKVGNVNPSGNGMNGNVFNDSGISPTLTTNKGEGIKIIEATKQGYKEAYDGDSVNLEQPNSKTRRGRVGNQVAQTLTTSCNQATIQNLRIRKLTPLECWRLMGFDDRDFIKAQKVNSNSQLYKQAGNSIVVNVLENIFKNLLRSE